MENSFKMVKKIIIIVGIFGVGKSYQCDKWIEKHPEYKLMNTTTDIDKMITEIKRVLRPGGEAIMMVYNRNSWLNAMSKVMKVGLEHEDAPVLKKYSIDEYRQLLSPLEKVTIIPERFPVETKLHHGIKAALYNKGFVKGFNLLPRTLVRSLGWHLMAFASK